MGPTKSELLDLRWPVDQDGYVLEQPPLRQNRQGRTARPSLLDFAEPPGPTIRPKGGPIREYRPCDCPALHRRFANLALTEEACLSFASEFGLLGLGFFKPDPMRGRQWSESITDWFEAIDELSEITEKIDRGSRTEAIELFNARLRVGMTIRINMPNVKPHLAIVPYSLIGVMYLQLAQELTEEIGFRKCQMCPEWFAYGPGTGHGKRKQFCSDRCRVAFHRASAGH